MKRSCLGFSHYEREGKKGLRNTVERERGERYGYCQPECWNQTPLIEVRVVVDCAAVSRPIENFVPLMENWYLCLGFSPFQNSEKCSDLCSFFTRILENSRAIFFPRQKLRIFRRNSFGGLEKISEELASKNQLRFHHFSFFFFLFLSFSFFFFFRFPECLGTKKLLLAWQCLTCYKILMMPYIKQFPGR